MFITYLEDLHLQPTYIGGIIQLLSTMDNPVLDTNTYSPPNKTHYYET